MLNESVFDPGKYTVLVVDDDQMVLDLLLNVITETGYNVIAARNGQEAVDLFRTFDIDVVLMDLIMPIMDGLSAYMEIQSIDPTTEVILMSGYYSKLVRTDKYSILEKPLRPSDVLKQIQDKLSYKN